VIDQRGDAAETGTKHTASSIQLTPNQPEFVDLTEPRESRLSAGSSSSKPAMLSGDGASLAVALSSSNPVMLLRLAASDCDSIATGCDGCGGRVQHAQNGPQRRRAMQIHRTYLVFAEALVLRSSGVRVRGCATRTRHRLHHGFVSPLKVDVRASSARRVGAVEGRPKARSVWGKRGVRVAGSKPVP
jgi:hypothetical protein